MVFFFKLSIAEEAAKLRECATDISEALSEIDGFHIRLKDIATEVSLVLFQTLLKE